MLKFLKLIMNNKNLIIEKLEDVNLKGRLSSLTRCFENIIQNGLMYGEKVYVSLQKGSNSVIVNIEDSSPPDQVQEAFDDVIKAREDEVRARNEAETYANGLVPEARGQAPRMLQDAEAYKEQVISEAQGDAARFNLLLAEYQKAPEVTRNRLYLESIQGIMSNSTKVMVDVEGGNNILYLPLDKIAQSARGAEGLNIPSITNNSTSIRELTDQVIEEIRRRNRQEERR